MHPAALKIAAPTIAALTLAHPPPAWAHLGPNAAILALTFGLLLIYLECNRPGTILPGAAGLTLTLIAIAALARFHPAVPAVALILSATTLLFLDLLRPTSALLSVAATLALIGGFAILLSGSPAPRVQPVTAVLCGLILGIGTSLLTRIARRARANKALD